MSVFTFGETVLALRGSGPLRLGGTLDVAVTGAESNVATGLARLGHEVRWAGAVGADEAGELVLRTLRAEGVDVSAASVDEGAPTGLVLLEPRQPGRTRSHPYRAGSAASRIRACAIAEAFTAAPPALLHLTGITPALGRSAQSAACLALQLASEHSAMVCLDVNHRPELWSSAEAAQVLREWAPRADILFATEDELALCLPEGSPDDTGQRAEELLALGVGEVVVKPGAAGATVYAAGARPHRPARAIRSPDAACADDAFVAGYLSGLLDGAATADRLDRATAAEASAAASPGGWEGTPTRAELALLTG
ncbi:sugar kinase [Streptomyces xanthochromogenes]|uniref:sugar kinase n=1 Tax=Streptomyces xanthochromogenes TaxID=67384 RepID=UPI0034120080